VPIYVYECEQCGEQFEYTQSMNDPPKTVCENCGGKLVRVIAPTAFVLKGGGWYKDLYSSSRGGKSEAKPDAKTDAKTESKTETKTETKTKTEKKE